VALPPVLAKVNKTLTMILLMVGLVSAGLLAYLNFETVDDEIVFQANVARHKESTVTRLKDIRTAQEEYVKVKGYYASDFDSLIAFVQLPIIPIPFQSGGAFLDSLPAKDAIAKGMFIRRNEVAGKAAELGMSPEKLEQAIAQNKVPLAIRDTSYASVYDQFFAPEVRKKRNLPAFKLEELGYSPFSGQKFIMKTGKIDQSGVILPTVLVKDPTPFGREGLKADTLKIGSLTESHTNGNWGN
jgi:hypothetical protein